MPRVKSLGSVGLKWREESADLGVEVEMEKGGLDETGAGEVDSETVDEDDKIPRVLAAVSATDDEEAAVPGGAGTTGGGGVARGLTKSSHCVTRDALCACE